jgi:hypothetical protein
MNLKRSKAIIIVLLVIAAVLIVIYFRSVNQVSNTTFVRKRGGPCPGEIKTFVMQDLYLRGILEPGQKFRVITNYYNCHPVKRNDLVFYQFSTAMDPVVKIARGIPGDKFELKPFKPRHAWSLLINGDEVKSELPNHEVYFFGAASPPTLSLYVKSRNSHLGADEIIGLSSYPPGDSDSGTAGIIKLVDVVGKVELLNAAEVKETAKPSPKPTATPAPTATATKKKRK